MMECGIVWIENMVHEKGRYQKIGGFPEVDKSKDGESQLDGTPDK